MANILIVDDHPVARLAVRMLLEKDGHTIIAEAGEGYEALKLVRQHEPSMITVDLDIPGLGGVELIEKLRINGYRGGILVLTARDDEHYISRCKATGSDGFVGKKNNLEELGDAVRAILRGYGYFPLNRGESDQSQSLSQENQIVSTLSNREVQVLQYLARGEKVIDIATKMHISNKTVSTYKTRILTKLNLVNHVELIDFARRNNLD